MARTGRRKNIIHEPDGKNTFDVYYKGELFGNFHLNVPGDHNIANALASIAAAHFVGVCPADCQKGVFCILRVQNAVSRKMAKKSGVVVIDDYAHHPTEIKAALAAAKNGAAPYNLVRIPAAHLFQNKVPL